MLPRLNSFLKSINPSFLVGFILLAGVFLRLWRLAHNDLWFDETCSIYISERLSDYIARDYNPPLYYVLLHFWIRFLGSGEFFLRFFSVVFNVATIFIIYKLGRLLLDVRVGLVSAFLLALSPLHIWYSQEARGYTLSIFFTVLSVYFFVSALKKDKFYFWCLFTASSICSLYSSYYFIFIVFGEFVVLLASRYRRFIGKWLASSFFSLLAFLPLLGIFLNQVKSVKKGFWVNVPTLGSVIISFENFNTGYNAGEVIYFFGMLLFSALFAYGIFYCYRKSRENAVILFSFALLPVIMVFAVSHWIPVYIDRHLILYSAFYYIAVAVAVDKISKSLFVRAAVLICLSALMVYPLFNYFSGYMPSGYEHHVGTYAKKPFKPLVNYIKRYYREGDVIVHTNPSTMGSFLYYCRPKIKNLYFFIPSYEDPYWKKLRLEQGALTSAFDLTRNAGLEGYRRIWLVSSSWSRDGALDDNSKAVMKFLSERYPQADFMEFDGIIVVLYSGGTPA
jgi:4-amino-4-deoxy-L-arabinose transferase-like glycosyltransferase